MLGESAVPPRFPCVTYRQREREQEVWPWQNDYLWAAMHYYFKLVIVRRSNCDFWKGSFTLYTTREEVSRNLVWVIKTR